MEHRFDIVGKWEEIPVVEMPVVEMPVVDWSRFPRHIVALAMDEGGYWFAYTYVPILCPRVWDRPPTLDVTFHQAIHFCRDERIPKYEGRWEDSLCIRPGVDNDNS